MKKLKKILTNPRFIKQYSYFHAYVQKTSLWQVNCHSMARGVAAGLFSAVIPVIPFQAILAIFLAILIRGNLPAAFLICWISNPFTYLPIAYFIYQVGNWIIGQPDSNHISELGKSYFIGVAIVSIGVALLGYFITIILWQGYAFIKRWRNQNHK